MRAIFIRASAAIAVLQSCLGPLPPPHKGPRSNKEREKRSRSGCRLRCPATMRRLRRRVCRLRRVLPYVASMGSAATSKHRGDQEPRRCTLHVNEVLGVGLEGSYRVITGTEFEMFAIGPSVSVLGF